MASDGSDRELETLGMIMTTAGSIPTAPRALPLLGHLAPLLRDPLAFLTSLPKHGDLVRVRIGPATVFVVCGPGVTLQVLRDDRTFDKGGFFFDRAREVVGDGLGICPHSRHRRQRRLLQPAFHPTRMSGYAPAMVEQITAVTNSWRDGQVLDVLAEMMAIASRTLAATLFSDALPSAKLGQALDDVAEVFAGMYRRMLMPAPLDRLPTPGNRRYHRASVRLRGALAGLIADRRASGADHGDLLSALLAARDDTAAEGAGQILSDTEISDQMVQFFTAGIESTANVLSWALHLLAQHPDIELRLRAEVDTVLAGASASYEHLLRLNLTARVVTETLRLYPTGWIFTRVVTADTTLGGQPLPAGAIVVYSPHIIHHRADLHPDPERFDPDRWDTTQHGQPSRDAFMPFGGGARKCIGDRFSLTEAVLALATIVARWHLQPIPGTHVRPALSAVLTPRGLRMRAVTITPHQPQTQQRHEAGDSAG